MTTHKKTVLLLTLAGLTGTVSLVTAHRHGHHGPHGHGPRHHHGQHGHGPHERWQRLSPNQRAFFGWSRVLTDQQLSDTLTYLGSKYPDHASNVATIAKQEHPFRGSCRGDTPGVCKRKINNADKSSTASNEDQEQPKQTRRGPGTAADDRDNNTRAEGEPENNA